MGNAYRLDQIYNILLKKKSSTVEDLADSFHVTPTTIRRDLLELEEQGLIYRTRGSAFLLESRVTDANLFMDEKKRIAAAAANYVTNELSVALDSGTTTMALAQNLVDNPELVNPNFLTHSPKLAMVLSQRFPVSLPGGVLSPQQEFLMGPWTENFYKDTNVDVVFLGSTGVRNCGGLTVPNPLQLTVKQHAARCASRCIALLDSSKYSNRGIYVFCDFKNVDTLITVHTQENEGQLEQIARAGVEIILV